MENEEKEKEITITIIGDDYRTTIPKLLRFMLNLEIGDSVKWLTDGKRYYVEKSE